MLYFFKSTYTDKFVNEAIKTYHEIKLISNLNEYLDTRFNKLIIDESQVEDIKPLNFTHKVYVFQSKPKPVTGMIGLGKYQTVAHNLNLLKDVKNAMILVIEKSDEMVNRLLNDINLASQNVLYMQLAYTPGADINLFYLSGLESRQQMAYLKGHFTPLNQIPCFFPFNHLKDALDPPLPFLKEVIELLLKEYTLVIGTSELKGKADAFCLEEADKIITTDLNLGKGLHYGDKVVTIEPIKYEKDMQKLINML